MADSLADKKCFDIVKVLQINDRNYLRNSFCLLEILVKVTDYFLTYLALRDGRTESKVTKTFTVKVVMK